MKNSNIFRILGLLGVALLLGCFERSRPVQVAGGDDYPNGIEPLGKKSARVRGDSADWNGFDSVPRSGPGLYDTVNVPDSVPDTSKTGKGSPSPKRAAYANRTLQDTALPLGGLPKDTGLAGGGLPKDTGLAGGGLPKDTGLAGSGLPKDTGLAGGGLPADTGLVGGGTGKIPPLDTLVTRVLDTAKGTVEAVRTQVTDSGKTQVDSTVFVPANPTKPGSVAGVNQVARRITYPDTGSFDLLRFADADGDGFLSPRAGSANLALVEVTAARPGGILEKRTQRIAAGADLDFNARGDNQLLASQYLRTAGLDTLALIKFLDADGDSLLIDFTKDTNIVDLIEEHRFAPGGPLSSVTRRVRIVVDSKDSTKNYPIQFTERRIFRDGVILDVTARGLGADSSFRAGAEALWTEARFHAITDTVARSVKAYKVRMAAAPGAFQGNVLIGFTVEEVYRKSPGGFFFDFRCETPVADRLWVKSGDVIAWLILDSGARVVFKGDATAAGMKGHVTDSDKESTALTFDISGSIVKP